MDRIGWWATTPRSRKWHLIESEIGMDVVTRCGRRLRDVPLWQSQKDVRTHDTPLPLCVYCSELRAL